MMRNPSSLLLTTLTAALVAGCGSGGAPAAFTPPTVTVAAPVQREFTARAEFTGTLRPVASVDVRARVTGVLQSFEFQPSAMVTKGQRLFLIEQEQYIAGRKQAEAFLKSSQAELAKATSDLERIEQAITTNAVSEQDLDLAKANKLKAEASVLAGQAQLADAKLKFSYTEVTSPIDGQVSRNFVDPGNLVGSGDNTLLTRVNQMDPIAVYFNIPERFLLERLAEARENSDAFTEDASKSLQELQLGISVGLSNEKGFPHSGVIDFIDNQVDAATGTIQLRGELPNQDLVLTPGSFVRVRVPARLKQQGLFVPDRAIGTDLGGKYLYVVGEDNVVEQRYVTLGQREDDGMVEVEEGLEGNERLIVNGLLRARPGLPVTPTTGDTPQGTP